MTRINESTRAGKRNGARCLSALVTGMTLCLAQLMTPLNALAQEAGGGGSGPANLDMSSTHRTIQAGSVANFQNSTLRVGQTNRSITASTMLTPAESLALSQVLSGSQQALQLTFNGNANGGSVNLTSHLGSDVANLVVPRGVTALGDFGAAASLNVLGNITNQGSIFALSTSAVVTNAIFNGTNIINKQGGLISSVLPAGSFGFTNAIANLNLTLNAIQDVINQGTVRSAGSLFVNAGGTIANGLPPGATGAAAVMQAISHVNLMSALGSITNSGVISSVTGNINVLAAGANSLVFNNTGGTVQALAGAINVRDALFTGSANTLLTGGNWLSQELNLFGGQGTVDVGVGQVYGVVNASACNFHILANTPNLQIGELNLSGDPVFVNASGDLSFNDPITTNGEALAILAAGNIFLADLDVSISTTGPTNGGDITIIAGAQIVDGNLFSTPVNQLRVVGASATGGNIKFNDVGLGLLSMTSSAAPGTGNAGNIQIAAFRGARYAGTIDIGGVITARGDGGGSSGDITIIAGSPAGLSATSLALNVPSIFTDPTSGNATGTGNITLATATPTFTNVLGGGACSNCFIVESGIGPTAGSVLGNSRIVAGAVQSSSLASGPLTTGGGDVVITAGNAFITGIDTLAVEGDGGDVTITTASKIPFTFFGGPGLTNGTSGGIATRAISTTTTLTGGDITISNNGTGGINVLRPGSFVTSNNVAFNMTNAGSINLSTQGDLTFDTSVNTDLSTRAATGGTAGSGGNVNLTARTINVVGPIRLLINVSGAGAAPVDAPAGSVNILQTSTGKDLSIGGSAGQISVIGNATTGDAGSLTLTSGRSLFVDPSALSFLPGTNGDGAHLNLTSGNSSGSQLTVSGNLSLLGNGTGSGGVVNITHNAGDLFLVGLTSGSGVSGNIDVSGNVSGDGGQVSIITKGTLEVVSNIIAAGGATSGDGGAISLTASGSHGGIRLAGNGVLDVAPTVGNGGSLHLETSNNDGIIFGDATPLDVSAFGGTFDGGQIFISTPKLTALAGPFALAATASGQGNGGSVEVAQTGTDFSSAFFSTIDARGGFFAMATGNSGTIKLSSGRNLVITTLNFDAMTRSNNGNGPTYSFNAGTHGTGRLKIDGALNANAVGTGNAGEIELSMRSGTEFQVNGNNGLNFVNGSLSAQQPFGAGDGGTISITNHGSGGIRVNSAPSSINVLVSDGNGGRIELISPTGQVRLITGLYDVAAHSSGPSYDGGTFVVDAGDVVNMGGAVTINADGVNSGAGGGIGITQTLATTGTLSITGSQFALSAKGGATGNGGDIFVSTGGALTVDPTQADAGASGGNGNGAHYTFRSGTNRPGNLVISGPLNANGFGTGVGGSIILASGGSGDFTVGPLASGAGNVGLLTASGTTGGTIKVTHTGQELRLDATTSVSVLGSNGDGGHIELSAPKGALTIPTSGSNVLDASGGSGGDGGSIVLNAVAVKVGNTQALRLLANGDGTGSGGTVTVVSSGRDSDLSALFGTGGNINIEAAGGTTSGDGGQVTVKAGRSLITSNAGIQANPTDGQGADLTFEAGRDMTNSGGIHADGAGNHGGGTINVTAGRHLLVLADISADGGSGTADQLDAPGGTVNITVNSNKIFEIGGSQPGINGLVSARGGTVSGDGGTVNIRNNGTGGITLSSPTDIQVTATQGNGGTIKATAPNGAITFSNGGVMSADGAGSGIACCSGGTIELTGRTIVNSTGQVVLRANAAVSDQGDGGTIKLTATAPGASIGVGNLPLQFYVQARSHSSEQHAATGGTVEVSAGANVTVDTDYLDLSNAGDGVSTGGTLKLTAVGAGVCCGNVSILGNLTLSGDAGGGSLIVNTNSASPFTVSPTQTSHNGISGDIDVSGDIFDNSGYLANGGSVLLKNSGKGGISLLPTAFITADGQPSSTVEGGGNGGSIELDAGTGNLVFANSTLRAAVSNGKGGTIKLTAALAQKATGAIGPLQLIANGDGGGDGGTVNINLTGALSDLVTAGSAGGFIISAQGGFTSTSSINPSDFSSGGTVSIAVKRNLTLNTDFFTYEKNAAHDGNGANLTFTAGLNLVFRGTPLSPVAGFGNGGSIVFNATGAKSFQLANPNTSATSGVTGELRAPGGLSGGNGGKIEINAPLATLLIPNGSSLRADSVLGDGGIISLTSTRLLTSTIGGGTPISASSSGAGSGGTVKITVTGDDITLNNLPTAFRALSIRANGDSALADIAGNGGTVELTAGKSIFFKDASGLSVSPLNVDGDGGTIKFSAGANIQVPFGLNVDGGGATGSGFGNGGTISLQRTSTAGGVFTFVGGPTNPNGVHGAVTARGGLAGGNGGTIFVNSGAAVIVLNQISNFTAVGIAGGTSVGAGGSITLRGAGVAAGVSNISPVNFLANGSGEGNGGNIHIIATGKTNKDIVIGSGAGNFILDASGGSSSSRGGNGGTIEVQGANILVTNIFALRVDAQGAVGNGGNVSLSATAGNAGRIQIVGNLKADSGSDFGNGGTIVLKQASPTLLNITSASLGAASGIQGTLSAESGRLFGNGGTIELTNLGTGGILDNVPAGSISVATNHDNRNAVNGTIRMTATQGNIFFGSSSGSLVAGNNDAKGGLISLTGKFILVDSGTNLVLNVLSTSSSGGTVELTKTDINANLTISTNPGQISIVGGGGNANFLTADSGTVRLSAGKNLTIDTPASSLILQAVSLNSSGATIQLTSGATNLQGLLLINNNLSANANQIVNGYGNGGIITLSARNSTRFSFDNSVSNVNGVRGTLSASASSNGEGSGGTISITQTAPARIATGGIGLDAGQQIFVDAGGNGGAGGTVTLTANLTPVVILGTGTSQLNVPGVGASGLGGKVTITADAISYAIPGSGKLSIFAQGQEGGTVKIRTIQPTAAAALRVSNDVGVSDISINVLSTPSLVGSPGTIEVQSANNLTVKDSGLQYAALNPIANGASLTLASGFGGTATGNLDIDSTTGLDVSGSQLVGGNGGSLVLQSRATTVFVVNDGLFANGTNTPLFALGGAGFGHGGSISVTALGATGLRFFNTTDFQVAPTVGNGGTLALSAPTGVIGFAAPALDVSGSAGSYNGGSLSLTALTLSINTGVSPALSANGTGNGIGGTISLTSTGSLPLTTGIAAGQFELSALGGNDLLALGVTGTGGTINLTAGTVNLGVISGGGSGIHLVNVATDPGHLTDGGKLLVTSSTGAINVNQLVDVGLGLSSLLSLNSKTVLFAPAGIASIGGKIDLFAKGAIAGLATAPILIRTAGDVFNDQGVSAQTAGIISLQVVSFTDVALRGANTVGAVGISTNTSTMLTGNYSGSTLTISNTAGTTDEDRIVVLGNISANPTKGIVTLSTNTASTAGRVLNFGGAITAGTLVVSSINGDIGTSTAPLLSAVGLLQLQAPVLTADAFAFNLVPTTLSNSQAKVLSVTSCGRIAVASATGGVVELQTLGTTAGADFISVTNLTATNRVELVAATNILGSGIITAPLIRLTAGPQGIASKVDTSGGRLELITTASATQKGNVAITSVDLIELGSSDVAGDLTLTSIGGITTSQGIQAGGTISLTTTTVGAGIEIATTIQANTAVNLTTAGNGAVTSNSGSITAPFLTLTSASGNFGTGGTPLEHSVDHISVTTLGSASLKDISSLPEVVVLLSKASAGFNLESPAATIRLNSITTGAGDLTVTATSGGIIVQPTATLLSAGGAINLSASTTMVVAGTVTNTTGAINLTAVNSLGLALGKTIGTTTGSITLNVTNQTSGLLDLNGIVSIKNGPGAINLTSAKDLTAFTVTNKFGDITMTAGTGPAVAAAALILSPNAKIDAREGNIFISNQLDSVGTIATGLGVTVQAISTNVNLGKVTVFIGDTPPTGTAGAPPLNVTITQIGGGVVFLGTNSISALAPLNKLTAKAQSLVFDVGTSTLGAAAITLGGKNVFLADPPIPTAGVGANRISLAHQVVAPILDNIGAIEATTAGASVGTYSSANFVAPSVNTLVPTAPAPVEPAGNVESVEPGVSSSHRASGAEFDHMQPIAYTPAIASGSNPSTAPLFAITNVDTARVKHGATDKIAVDAGDSLTLSAGEAVVTANRATSVIVGSYLITVPSGAAIHCSHHGGIVKLQTLVDGGGKTVSVVVEGKRLDVPAGHEVVLGANLAAVHASVTADGIGRRSVDALVVNGKHAVMRSQVPLVTLVRKTPVLAGLSRSSHAGDRALSGRILKMAACLMQVTSRFGAYTAVDATKVPVRQVKTTDKKDDKLAGATI